MWECVGTFRKLCLAGAGGVWRTAPRGSDLLEMEFWSEVKRKSETFVLMTFKVTQSLLKFCSLFSRIVYYFFFELLITCKSLGIPFLYTLKANNVTF